jgi:hypothetical protein
LELLDCGELVRGACVVIEKILKFEGHSQGQGKDHELMAIGF